MICQTCNGSGEGRTERHACFDCGGSGEAIDREAEKQEAADYQLYDEPGDWGWA